MAEFGTTGQTPDSDKERYRELWSSTCLAGQVAVVTGVSGGIGAELVRGLSAVGATVYGLTRSPGAEHMTADGVTYLRADAGNAAEVRRAVAEIVRREGQLDIAVANAAKYTTQSFEALTTESWEADLRINLTGPFVLFHAATETMQQQQSGCLVGIGSTAGARGGTVGHVAYGAGKAGLEGLCKGLARELGPQGIRVNVLALGPVDGTQLSAEVRRIRGDAYGTAGPLRRPAEVHEATNGVIFLASSASSFVTGSVVRLDGGALYSGR